MYIYQAILAFIVWTSHILLEFEALKTIHCPATFISYNPSQGVAYPCTNATSLSGMVGHSRMYCSRHHVSQRPVTNGFTAGSTDVQWCLALAFKGPPLVLHLSCLSNDSVIPSD